MGEGLLYVFISGLAIGFAGNFHCIGMCGPLVIAGSTAFNRDKNIYLAGFIYHSLRIIAYVFIGIIFGYIGQSISIVLFQQWLSIGAAIFIFIYLFVFYSKVNQWIDRMSIIKLLKNKISNLLVSEKSNLNIAQLGFMNGLLPCGLVYVAGLTATASGSFITGTILMLGFGLATFPVMFFLMVIGRKISFNVRMSLKKLSPVFIFSVAFLLLLRGMNLGIPFVSPKVENQSMQCCHKPGR